MSRAGAAAPARLHKAGLSCWGCLVQPKRDQQDVVNRLQQCLLGIPSDVGTEGISKEEEMKRC